MRNISLLISIGYFILGIINFSNVFEAKKENNKRLVVLETVSSIIFFIIGILTFYLNW